MKVSTPSGRLPSPKQREASIHNWRLFSLKGNIAVILASTRPWLSAQEYNELVRLLTRAREQCEAANKTALALRKQK